MIDTIQNISDVLYQGLQVRVFAGQIPMLSNNADIRTVHPSWSIKGLLMKCGPGSSYALTVLLARALDPSAKMRVLLALKPGTAKCPCFLRVVMIVVY